WGSQGGDGSVGGCVDYGGGRGGFDGEQAAAAAKVTAAASGGGCQSGDGGGGWRVLESGIWDQIDQNKVQQMRGARERAYAIDGGIFDNHVSFEEELAHQRLRKTLTHVLELSSCIYLDDRAWEVLNFNSAGVRL
nr:hypothetical protein [Tanacetum cinerariifolium]